MIEFDLADIEKEPTTSKYEVVILSKSKEPAPIWNSTEKAYTSNLITCVGIMNVPNYFNNDVVVSEVLEIFFSAVKIRGIRSKTRNNVWFYFNNKVSTEDQFNLIAQKIKELNPELQKQLDEEIEKFPNLLKAYLALEHEYQKMMNKEEAYLFLEKERKIKLCKQIIKSYDAYSKAKKGQFINVDNEFNLDAYELEAVNEKINCINKNAIGRFLGINNRIDLYRKSINEAEQEKIATKVLGEFDLTLETNMKGILA